MISWQGFSASAGTPAPVIERLNAETNDVLAHPEMRKWQAEQGLEPLCGQPGTLGSLLAAALPRWETLVRRAGIRAD